MQLTSEPILVVEDKLNVISGGDVKVIYATGRTLIFEKSGAENGTKIIRFI